MQWQILTYLNSSSSSCAAITCEGSQIQGLYVLLCPNSFSFPSLSLCTVVSFYTLLYFKLNLSKSFLFSKKLGEVTEHSAHALAHLIAEAREEHCTSHKHAWTTRFLGHHMVSFTLILSSVHMVLCHTYRLLQQELFCFFHILYLAIEVWVSDEGLRIYRDI
jgi:hypothetical protein